MKDGRRLRQAGSGSRAGVAGEAGAWEARKGSGMGRRRILRRGGGRWLRRCHRARATHGVQQVERAQAVLGAREAPAHHRGAWASGSLRFEASSAGLGE